MIRNLQTFPPATNGPLSLVTVPPAMDTLYSSSISTVSWSARYTTPRLLGVIWKSSTFPPATRAPLSLVGVPPSMGTLYSSSTPAVGAMYTTRLLSAAMPKSSTLSPGDIGGVNSLKCTGSRLPSMGALNSSSALSVSWSATYTT